jgi:hypothetical protein
MNGDIGAGNRHPICQRAVAAIQDVANVIGEIDQISTAIALAIGEQGSATMEISRSVQGAAQGTREVSSNIGRAKSSRRVRRNRPEPRRSANRSRSMKRRFCLAEPTQALGHINPAVFSVSNELLHDTKNG